MKDGKFVFRFTDGSVIRINFSLDVPMETVANNILRLMNLRANLRSIDGIARKSAALPMHRKFEVSVHVNDYEITSSLKGLEYSPKCLTSTINRIVSDVYTYACVEADLLGSVELEPIQLPIKVKQSVALVTVG